MFDFITDPERLPYWIPLLFLFVIIVYNGVFLHYVGGRQNIAVYDNTLHTAFISLVYLSFAMTDVISRDYFSYREIVQSANQWIDDRYFTVEPIYQRLAYWCNNNYDLFRFVIFGGAILLLYKTTCIFKVSPYLTLTLHFLLFHSDFTYARASLAMAIYFYGFALFVTSGKNRWGRIIIGGLVIAISSIFHREMLILIALTPLVFLKLSKKNVIVLLIFTILVFMFLFRYVDAFLSLFDDSYNGKYSHYQDEIGSGRWQTKNWKGYLQIYSGRAVYYIGLIFVTIGIFSHSKKDETNTPQSLLKLYGVTFWTIAMSMALSFAFGLNNPFGYRTLFMSHIPLSILLSYLLTTGRIKKEWVYILLALAFVCVFLRLRNTLIERCV